MAALLHMDVLRRLAPPAPLAAALGLPGPAEPWIPRNRSVVVRPVASWQVGSDGRLTCFWTLEQAETLGRPPD